MGRVLKATYKSYKVIFLPDQCEGAAWDNSSAAWILYLPSLETSPCVRQMPQGILSIFLSMLLVTGGVWVSVAPSSSSPWWQTHVYCIWGVQNTRGKLAWIPKNWESVSSCSNNKGQTGLLRIFGTHFWITLYSFHPHSVLHMSHYCHQTSPPIITYYSFQYKLDNILYSNPP